MGARRRVDAADKLLMALAAGRDAALGCRVLSTDEVLPASLASDHPKSTSLVLSGGPQDMGFAKSRIEL